MLASSKILPALNVDVEASHTVVNSTTDPNGMLSASSPKCHSLVINNRESRTRNAHHGFRGGSRKIPPKSPDLIELSDAAQSPISVNIFTSNLTRDVFLITFLLIYRAWKRIAVL